MRAPFISRLTTEGRDKLPDDGRTMAWGGGGEEKKPAFASEIKPHTEYKVKRGGNTKSSLENVQSGRVVKRRWIGIPLTKREEWNDKHWNKTITESEREELDKSQGTRRAIMAVREYYFQKHLPKCMQLRGNRGCLERSKKITSEGDLELGGESSRVVCIRAIPGLCERHQHSIWS